MRAAISSVYRIVSRPSSALVVVVFSVLGAPLDGPATALAADDSEKPPEIIASHIRTQGFKCDKPKSAVRDEKASKPDEPVWTLECENATYRVREIPDQAAKVERLD